MADENQTNPGGPDLVSIVIDGLRKSSHSDARNDDERHTEETCTERILLPETEPISVLWAKVESRGYDAPRWLQEREKKWASDEQKLCVHPFQEIEVVQGRASENGICINIDDPLIAFTNRYFKTEINLEIAESNSDDYGTAMESLKYDGGLNISFHRTIRMPDDDRLHQLPGSLGAFPLYNVSSYASQLPENIVQQGGVFLPMWQREALWIKFDAPYPQTYALRVFVGRINAVSGLPMDESMEAAEKAEAVQDYVIVPGQEWLDGICVAPGIVRQFVAMPLGSGYTVEGQKTGREKFGGLQIEIVPSYKRGLRTWQAAPTGQGQTTALFDRYNNLNEQKTPLELKLNPGVKIRSYPSCPTYWTPYHISDLAKSTPKEDTHVKALYEEKVLYQPEDHCAPGLHISNFGDRVLHGNLPLSREWLGAANMEPGYAMDRNPRCSEITMRSRNSDTEIDSPKELQDDSHVKVVTTDLTAMGLAAGGKLVQDIYRDSNPARNWNTESTRLVHIHILDPASCEKVTHIVPPPPPIDAMGYVEADMPFFVVEEQVDNRVDGGDFDNITSVSAMDKEKGVTTELAFDLSKPKMCKECETRLCDCIVRPCDHQFCNVCVKKLEMGPQASNQHAQQWKCPTCGTHVSHVAGFSAPMNLPGEETGRIKVPVHVLKIEDGRVRFKSINKTRI